MGKSRKYWDEMAKAGPDRSVIDPNDTLGNKIQYISSLRNGVILSALKETPPGAKVLDFGCGSGSLSRELAVQGYLPIGLDVSLNLLRYAECDVKGQHLFVQYGGDILPFTSERFDACATFEVLQHITDRNAFCHALDEIYRVLKKGGQLIAVEQVSRKEKFKAKGMKVQRTEEDILQALASAGFRLKENSIVRRGHFLLIYAIRYGLIPPMLFSVIGTVESLIGKIFRRPCLDYANMLFVVEKPY